MLNNSNNSTIDAINNLEAFVDKLLKGKTINKGLDLDSFPEEFKPLAEKISSLTLNVSEVRSFSREIASGNLNVEIPDKTNLLSGEVKEIHSQFSSFCWSLEQLVKGNIVSKLYYPGELFEIYNDLISKISQILTNQSGRDNDVGNSISSWRYHQILTALNQLNIMIIEVDENGKILFSNPPADKILNNSFEHLPYEQINIPNPLMKYLCSFSGKVVDIQEKNPIMPKYSEFHELYDHVHKAWYKITSNLVQFANGKFGLLHAIDDISEWKKYESLLKHSANHDALTSVYNRKAGMAMLEDFLQNRRGSSCIAFCDVDGLKYINDVYGHTEGDFAIKSIADVFLHFLRDSDIIIRYGGDEFILIFPFCEQKDIEEVVKRMYNRLEYINSIIDKPYELSFSIGYAPIVNEFITPEDLISLVDERMYIDKRNRKRTRES